MLKKCLFFFVILLNIPTMLVADEKSDSDRLYQTLVQAIQDKHYEQAQNALEDYMKCQSIVDYSENLGYFAMLCCIHFHFDHQEEVRHLMEQYYAKKKDDDPMFMYFFSLLNTHFGNYEKAIDDMTNAIVTIEKEPQMFLSKYKTPNISDQTALNSMLGQCYVARASLYAVVKNIANARTDMKKADTFPEMPDAMSALFYKNLDKMEKSQNSISLFVEKKQSFGHTYIINNTINSCPEIEFRLDENLPNIQEVFSNWRFPIKWDEKLLDTPDIPSSKGIEVPPTQTDGKSDCDKLYQTLIQAIQDKNYEQAQNALRDYMKCKYTANYSEDIGCFAFLCCIHFHFDHQEEVHHLMEQYYAKKKDDPMFMYFFSLLNTHFGNYEKAIDYMTNAIVTLEKEPQKFLSQYKNPNISDQTDLNNMLGATYLMRACLYAVVKNIANARTDMKKADTFIKMPGSFLEIFNAIPALFYKKLDKMEQSPNSISLFVGKKQSFGHIVITNNIINTCPEVAFKWDENLLDIQEVFFNWGFPIKLGEKLPYIPSLEKIDIPLFVPPTQTPSLPVAPITP